MLPGHDVISTGGSVAGDGFDADHEDVLSFLHGVAVANQPPDTDTGPVMVPVAFAARVSDKDKQDPTLSIPRQLAKCRAALPSYCVIVAFFWDAESGQIELDLRGRGDAHELFKVPVPRDGGIAELLEEARRPDRRFVAVVCESVDRLSRVTYFGTKIEYALEQLGVALLAADEGITAEALPSATGRSARKRATPILTRRVKQAIAEWYVLDMQERSWGGLMAHNEQGYNIGKPPYGYDVVTEPHPVPAKAADGKVKRRLVLDPVRGPVVTQIFLWRTTDKLSYDEIADRLNDDPDRYPPPQPILGRGRRAIGAWTKGSVREVLCNPKYTGHMVYNRRTNPRKDRGVPGRVNPPAEWIWSSKPTHEPLTTRALFDAGTPIGKAKKGSRPDSGPNRHPTTRRSYRLRSYVICELCNRRLYGKTRRVGDGYSYMACEPIPTHHAGRDWFATHPKSLWVREDKLLTVVRGFFTHRIFGPNRQALLAATADDPPAQDPTRARIAALQRKIADLDREQANIIAELRGYQATGNAAIDQQWRDQLRNAFTDIATRRTAAEAQLGTLTSRPASPRPSDPALLDHLPITQTDLSDLPEDLERDLWADFHLQVRYHQPTRRVTVRVTIDGQSIHRLAATSRTITGHRPTPTNARNTKRPPATHVAGGGKSFSLAGCAPGVRSTWDNPINHDNTITVFVPADPPPVRGGAARALLRLLRNVFDERSTPKGAAG